jgi:hypothetical protein
VSGTAETDANGTVVEPLGLTWGLNIANCGEPQSDGGTSSGGASSGSTSSGDAGDASSEGGAVDGGGHGKTW